MTLTFRCGHTQDRPDSYTAQPSCPTCGERVVVRVTVRPPSFVGTVRGPFARFEDLGAIPVKLGVTDGQ